ncbi:unnamed protein product [Ixodes hexagonus]
MSDKDAQLYFHTSTPPRGFLLNLPSNLHESSRFHKRAQQPGETVDGFFMALRNMVQKCNYSSPAVEDRLGRARFAMGLADSCFSDKLRRTPIPCLDDALVQARQHEETQREGQHLFLTAGQPPTAAHVDAATSRKPVQRAHERDSGSRDRPEGSRTSNSNVREASKSS